ncbi:unnamed protein product [Mytilus coruscus]|uniref:IRG-type G domain-containing protein n=1 Tax=Mytilus coruscus TaxID=42192 RepID=A0A6J8D7R4_MYTCO|nr:unnamed protein product [Mytilus coruscus]
MNRQEAICQGIKDGKRCSKLICNESVFCSDCESSNTDNVSAQSFHESDNESIGESDACESQDDDNGNDKWDVNKQFKTPHASDGKKRAPIKRSCKSCGHDVHKHQKFCNNCGYKIGAPCLGKIRGNTCTAFLNVEIKFCEDCGTANPDYIKEQCQVQSGEQDNCLPPNESVMTLTSMGFTREQAMDALKTTGDNIEEATHRILGIPVDKNKSTERKFSHSAAQLQSQNVDKISSIPSDESIIQLMSMGYTNEQAIYALQCCEGHIEKALDFLLSFPTDDDTMTRTEPALSEAQINPQCKKQTSLIPSHESVLQLTSVGFTKEQAIDALKCTNGNEEEAVSRLLCSVPDYDMEQMKAALTEVEEEIKDSDEESVQEFFTAPTDLPSESTDKTIVDTESRENIENDILNRLKTDGVIATAKFLMVEATKWKRAKVKMAVAGQSTAGKSAFINAIRGIDYKDEGYAKEGFGDTTMIVEKYHHPSFRQIIYFDLPGYGTTTIPREKFLEKVNLREYDMFIIFFTSVPTTDDEWLATQLREAKIPFCFVRTKLDQDIENGKRMGKNEHTVLNDILNTIANATESMPVLKDEQIFIISNHKPSVGDMSKLVKFMQQKVTTVKFEAILFSIPAFTEEIIEKKYKDLKDRIPEVAFCYATGFHDINALFEDKFDASNCDFNIRNQIIMYFKVFELDSVCSKGVPGLKHYYSDEHLLKLLKDFQEGMPGRLLHFVPIYSTIKRYRVSKNFLTNLLGELKTDAYTMYMYITKQL